MGKEREDHGPRPPSESVVIDIGESVGALVVIAPAALDGAEIHIQAARPGGPRTHTVVRPREVPGGGVVYAGVFPSLHEGEYALLPFSAMPGRDVTITGASVTELTW